MLPIPQLNQKISVDGAKFQITWRNGKPEEKCNTNRISLGFFELFLIWQPLVQLMVWYNPQKGIFTASSLILPVVST